ncbi:MAG: polysaccharide deacetylase family protein [Cyclobacteriaceae bacterium]
MFPFRPFAIHKRLFSECLWEVKTSQKTIYLTFDDGPTAIVTDYVLDQLDQFNARATFFLIGQNVQQHPELAQKLITAGHQVGNHTQHHVSGWKVKSHEYVSEVELCDQELANLKISSPFFRPPYGRIRPAQVKTLSRDKRIVMWSYLTGDFDSNLNIEKSLSGIKKLTSGAIIVFHDSQKAFSNLKKLLPETLSYFAAQGFEFKTIPE